MVRYIVAWLLVFLGLAFVLVGHDPDHVESLVRVAPLFVVNALQLDVCAVQLETGIVMEDLVELFYDPKTGKLLWLVTLSNTRVR